MIETDNRPSDSAIQARQREMAAEHILFHVVRHVEAQHPGLIDRIEASLDHLGDPARDGTADDEAVREIARRFLASARKA
jgi:plasmid stabilization system protein ParE